MVNTNWEEFSLLVEQELAEMITDLLGGILPGGIMQERIFEGVLPEDLDQEPGPVRIFGYLPIDDQLDEQREKINNALLLLSKNIPIPEPSYSSVEDQDWATTWQERYQPIPLGNRLIVVPSWLKNPAPERIPVYIDPASAFGSGTHPTTQISLILIEDYFSKNPAQKMIDIGCGSGILSIAAAKLGVQYVLGVDTDPNAIRISTENAIKNHVENQTGFSLGSIKEINEGKYSIAQAPLVVANIIAPVLKLLFEGDLMNTLLPEGTLILSGILDDQLPEFLTILDQHGLILQDQHQQDQWIGLITTRPINQD